MMFYKTVCIWVKYAIKRCATFIALRGHNLTWRSNGGAFTKFDVDRQEFRINSSS